MSIKFAVIGINHNHIYGQVDALIRGGGEFVSFYAPEDDLAKPFAERYPQAERVADKRRILEDRSIDLVVTAAIPAERAPIAMRGDAPRQGRDDRQAGRDLASSSSPSCAACRRRPKRIYSILYSEHFETRSTVKAGELVQAGAIGKVVQTVGLGPHRLNKPTRAGLVLRARALWRHSHRHRLAPVRAVPVLHRQPRRPRWSRRRSPTAPIRRRRACRISATCIVRTPRRHRLYPRRLVHAGRPADLGRRPPHHHSAPKGTIELRKYVDIAGAPGTDHLFLVDGKGVQHIDCANVELPYGRQLVRDVLDRTETAMPQARCFAAMELALEGAGRWPKGSAGR